MKLIKSSTWIK